MIGRIRGTLIHKQAPEIVVDVGGVGYELQVPLSSLFQLPEVGAEVALFTHFVVREDAQLLFGFMEEQDRRLFRQLIRVSGVGPKLALTILSGMDTVSFVRCVQRDDVSSLVALPGVGKKTAERLLVDMRGSLQEWTAAPAGSRPGTLVAPITDIVADAEGALVALGYRPQDASRVVAAVHDEAIVNSEELIRRALKSMAGG